MRQLDDPPHTLANCRIAPRYELVLFPTAHYFANVCKDPHSRGRPRIHTFSEILSATVSREKEAQTRGWCNKCHRYQSLQSHLSVRGAPDVLMINTAVKSPEAKQYWSIPGWLPQRIGVIIQNGKFYCFEGENLNGHLQRRLHVVKLYDLVGVVTDVSGGEHEKPHLVSLINGRAAPKNHLLTS